MHSSIVSRKQTVHYCGSVSQFAVVCYRVAQGSVAWTYPLRPLHRRHPEAGQIARVRCPSVSGRYAVPWVLHGLRGRARRQRDQQLDVVKLSSLNADKTQFIWLGTGHFLGKRDMQAIDTILSSTDVVNNLEVYLDSELTLERQVSKLCQVRNFHLRRLCTVRIAFKGMSTNAGSCLRHKSSGSLLRPPLWILFISPRSASVRAEFSRLLGSEHSKVQRNLGCHPWQVTLATNQKAHRVQHCSSGATLPGWCCTGVLDETVPSYQFRSASIGGLIIPRFWLQKFGFWAFAISSPQLWNSLPLDVRQSRDNLIQLNVAGRQSLRSASQGTFMVPRIRTERYVRRGFSQDHTSGTYCCQEFALLLKSLIFSRENLNII